MRKVALFFALPFAVLTVSGVASADVANEPKCKCSMPGLPAQGSVAAVMAAGGAVLLFARRRRQR